LSIERARAIAAPIRCCALFLVLLPFAVHAAPKRTTRFEDVATRAREIAAQPYREPERVPQWLSELDYDKWRDIRFRPDRAQWGGQNVPFTLQFFHPGLFYDRAVTVNEIDSKGTREIEFSPSLFDYGQSGIGSQVPQNLGFAGFRVHHPIKRQDYFDEVIVFLGASYFRAVARDLVYGLSARGLAIDTALASGEEFPWFREFWILRAAPGAKEFIILALLDSPSVAGAYRFTVTPGTTTTADVDVQLYFRRTVAKLGMAPLTSMFLQGENRLGRIEDFRPEVHDSDGLLVESSTGERIWRPLDARQRLTVTSFALENPRGFGLIQRDRDFDHYQDLEARPDMRPSVWITPRSDWGRGRVEIVEIPTRNDTNDNVVAMWVPEAPATGMVEISYRIAWFGEDKEAAPSARIVGTRRDRGNLPDVHRFVIDFEGPGIAKLPDDAVLQGVISIAGSPESQIVGQQVMKNPVTDGWRLVFQVRPSGSEPVELRAFLQRGESVLTETWSYLLQP
jgi:glucans biosynthesis protein